jgi:hypothetical protein
MIIKSSNFTFRSEFNVALDKSQDFLFSTHKNVNEDDRSFTYD